MLSCFKNHLRTSKNCLCCKFVCLCSRHSLCNSSICHCFDKHKYISRGASANRNDGIHHMLCHNFYFTKCRKNLACIIKFFFCYMFIRCGSCHTFSNHSRSVRHCTNNLNIFSKLFGKPCKCLSWCDRDNKLFRSYQIFYFLNDICIKLWFYRKNNNF